MSDAPYVHTLFQQVTQGIWRPGGLALTAQAVDACALPQGSLFLDVGCGTGTTQHFLQQRGYRLIGLDKYPHWQKPYQSLPTHSGPNNDKIQKPNLGHDKPQNTCLLCADAQHLPLISGCLDAIICECVLSLLPQPQQALNECARTLRPEGILLLTDIFLHTGHVQKAQGCLAGAVSPAQTEARLRAAGLALCHWKDHTDALRQLAAQLVWQGASLADLACWMGADCLKKQPARYGYALWTARKEKTP